MADISTIKHFLLDMDGTLYLGLNWLPGAREFLAKLTETGRDHLFVTNNCSKSKDLYCSKLQSMGYEATPEQFLTSGEATIRRLKKDRVKTVFVMGTESLENEFRDAGFVVTSEDAECIVLGFDITLTYEKIKRAAKLLRNGATFYGTHIDYNCPSEEGPLLDCGSMAKMFTAATNVEPIFCGKPCEGMVNAALERLGAKKENTAMVGDRLNTDIKMGIDFGLTSILVMTGDTTREMLEKEERKPDYVFESIKDLAELL